MKIITSTTIGLVASLCLAAPAYSSCNDVYVMNFRNADSHHSVNLDSKLLSALAIAGVDAEEVVIDTSNAAKWEKSAHEAFDRDVVPVFNTWVGLSGFAAVVDAKTKRVIGCINSTFTADEMAIKIREITEKAAGGLCQSRASFDYGLNYDFEVERKKSYIVKANLDEKTTECPAPVVRDD